MVQVEVSRDLQIRTWVENQLCMENDLMPGAFPMTQQLINRQGNLCGTLYCLHGPRSVRLVAVHDTQSDRILTYDFQGSRTGDYAAQSIVDGCSDLINSVDSSFAAATILQSS